MRLTYETGTATLIQFMVLGILNIVNALNSVITSCHDSKDCVTNALVSAILYILLVGWFAALWVVGYLAQERRSKLLAQILIAAEGMVVLLAVFNIKHHNDLIGLFTSIVDLGLAIWVIILALRLMASGGKRIVRQTRGRNRPRQRKHTI